MSEYVLTTPVRNERAMLPGLVEGIERQTQRPALWLVVDDHSSDGSLQWLQEAAATRSWLAVATAPEASEEYLGRHLARLKRFCLEEVLQRLGSDHEVLCVGMLDADVLVPPDFYERMIKRFDDDPRLGIASALHLTLDHANNPTAEKLQRPDWPAGPTQTFRAACLEAIGGLPPYPGEDGAANAKATMLDWSCRAFADITAIHRRKTSTREGEVRGYSRRGESAWVLGHHPIIVLGQATAYSIAISPATGLAFLWGWARAGLRREARCPDPDIRRYYGSRRLKTYVDHLFKGGGYHRT